MTPRPQEDGASSAGEQTGAAAGDRVVISGMAGLYPQARYVKDLQDILYNKVNPVSSETLRWDYKHPEVAQYSGNVPELDRFDAQFFKVHYLLGNSMDAMSRKILEQTFEAIYDAGMSPEHLAGKSVGVYVGSCFSETEKACFYVATSRTGFGIPGCSKTMFANRISYWLNIKGPSMSIDDACCSSMAALEAAYKAIIHGECEAAIVGGANLCLHPQSSVHYGRIMKISMDGNTKSFAEDAEGCTKSEAINVLFLQKARDAKRVYAEVIHVKCEFVSMMSEENGPRYGFYRDPNDTAKFLKEFYEEAGVSPNLIEYVEAFGSAVPEADQSELDAIDKILCNGKKEPLLVGSVMSNIGYGEAASGISAITKVLLGYHTGVLAGNLHGEAPRRDVAALREGRLRVLADHQPFHRGYTAVNSMSVTGVNAHVLLHGQYKQKNLERYKSNIPRLVTISSRQESAVSKILDDLKSHSIDPEELALLQNIHETNIAGHLGKGYTILDTNSSGATVSLLQCAEYCDTARRPLWFVYSGMGSQWAGMGAQLMRIPIFAAAVQRCHKVLEPKGLNIVHIITSPDKAIFDNILHSFVGIAAVQIGLTDVLINLGLVPDKILGHSVGELGCAYADGCLTAEEMILAAYSRGRVSLETPFIRGSMAAVGLGARQMSSMCPPEIAIACHNSAESCTISGPAEAMRSFVAELTAQSIFAKEVPCSNIAYHSQYIAEAGPGLLKYLKEVISTPRARSERWVSSSVPQARWQEPAAQYSSAEYHTNNLLSPVLFEEASAAIPADAVLVEVAPHGLLQAILKRALPDSAANIPLTRRGHPDSVVMLLDAIGKLYLHGYYPKVKVLYPSVEFPVSTGTPFLSHYVQWAHQDRWGLPLYQSARRLMTASCKFLISIFDDEYSYVEGHIIRGKTLLPFSFVLVAVWDTLAMSLNVPKKSIDVELTDVHLYTQPILNQNKTVKLSVSLHRGNGLFEVMESESKVATGFIKCKHNTTKMSANHNNASIDENLEAEEVYQSFYDRGYAYSGSFRSIHSIDKAISEAYISWNNNWVTFIDSLIQLNTLKYTSSGITQPHNIGRLAINIKNHFTHTPVNRDPKNLVSAQLSRIHNRTRSGGVLIENMKFRTVIQNNDSDIIMQTLKFVPRFSCNHFKVSTSLTVLLQIAAENINKDNLNVLGLISEISTNQLCDGMKEVVSTGIPKINLNYRQLFTNEETVGNKIEYEDVDVVLVQHLSKNHELSQILFSRLKPNSFIVNEEDSQTVHNSLSESYNVISVLKNTNTQLELLYWKPYLIDKTSTFTVRSSSDLSLLKNARTNLPPQDGLVILSPYPGVTGLMTQVNKWRREDTHNHIYVIMIHDKSTQQHTFDEYPEIILANSIFDNGLWGGNYYLPFEETLFHKENVALQCGAIGDLNSLKWQQNQNPIGSGDLVKVHYAGINTGDARRALGLSSKNDTDGYGMEFSGITKSGSRVMGLVSGGAARSTLAARPELTWPVPPHWTLEDAATVPLAYFLAYYCLLVKATMKPKNKSKIMTVLVHGGTGALGQAAISIALARGWRVFTTVADSSKKRFLMKLFSQLNDCHIGNSRDSTFGDMVLSATNGMGCDIVLCCLKGDLKNISLSCCGPSSLMFDTDQILSNENYLFTMNYLTKDRSYVAVDLTNVLTNPKSKDIKMLHSLVSEGIALGEVRPLSRVSFAEEEAARAFQLVAASRHRGRALLRLNHERAAPRHSEIPCEIPCEIVISDSNSLGIQMAEKLIGCGTRKLHLHFNALATPSLNYKQSVWKQKNIQVTVTSGNINDINDVNNFILHNAKTLGTVEGLHVIVENCSNESLIELLDLATVTTCPSLKRFMVFTKNINCGYNTCVQRFKKGLPATLVDLSMLDTVSSFHQIQDADGSVWIHGAAVAMESAVNTSSPISVAFPVQAPRQPLVQLLANLLDIKIDDKVRAHATLKDLGASEEKLPVIGTFLKDVYHHSLEDEDIFLLTIERITEIEKMMKVTEFEETTGLGTFFSYVDPDELLATTEMVPLPTLTNHYNMRDDEFNVNESFLCIVPGLEGHHERFRSLCERLKLSALVLQPGLDHLQETPAELAHRYSKVLLKKTGDQKNFYILGYETGVLVALELAAILEDHGGEGTVFCLGAGPAEAGAALEQVLRPYGSSGALQAAVARHMCALMARSAGEHAERALSAASSWGARVDACVRALRGRVPHSAQYARALLEAAHGRIGAARRAAAVQEVPRALRSRVVLLRARTDAADSGACSLQRYSRQPLLVRDLAAPLSHAAADPRAPAIINSCLDAQLLRAFDDKNLCDTYLSNADAFMTVSES